MPKIAKPAAETRDNGGMKNLTPNTRLAPYLPICGFPRLAASTSAHRARNTQLVISSRVR
jgi:hypothetical protein